ncbi:hypothetical protein niasHT_036338 [Heterodera trifolii]|uniref:Uncharacterized protein n=1 Tax=Heterodera trifolii TaxID=157864 RepID=A0ABD2I9G6_9BILA
MAIQADVGSTLVQLHQRMASDSSAVDHHQRGDAWLNALRSRDTDTRNGAKAAERTADERLNPLRLLRMLNEMLPDNTILVADGTSITLSAHFSVPTNQFLTKVAPILICIQIGLQTSPSFLSNLNIISIQSINLLPDAIADDGPNATIGQALSKWLQIPTKNEHPKRKVLNTPRKNGKPKRLSCREYGHTSKTKRMFNSFKKAFLRSNSSSANYIIQLRFFEPTLIESFELMNERTNEVLKMEKEDDDYYCDLKRCQIGATDQWEDENPLDNLDKVNITLYGDCIRTEKERELRFPVFLFGFVLMFLMDIFPHFDHAQLGLKLALLSPRFELLVDKHFDSKSEWTIWRTITICNDSIAKVPKLSVVIGANSVEYPLPDFRPLPNKIRFKYLQNTLIDHFVIKFLSDNQKIFDKSINLSFCARSVDDDQPIWNVAH